MPDSVRHQSAAGSAATHHPICVIDLSVGSRRPKLISHLVAAAAICACACPGSALATATIGTNMGNAANANMNGCNFDCTAVNRILFADSAPQGVTSPVNGTVTSWRFSDAAAGNTVSLRILRQATNQSFTGISTSAPQTSVIGLNGPFSTSLPIKAGDFVGLNAGSGGASFLNDLTPANFLDMTWGPPLGDGETRDGVGSNQEVMVQATVEPTNTFAVGAPVLNKKKGTATVPVGPFPNNGSLEFTPGAGANLAETAASKPVTTGQTVKFLVSATGKKRKKLVHKGKVTVAATFTYTPSFGTASTQSTTIKLKKKRKKH
jgi:hypothetical protein